MGVKEDPIPWNRWRAAFVLTAAGGTAAALVQRRAVGPPAVEDPCGPEGLAMPSCTFGNVSTDDGVTLAVIEAGDPEGPTVVLAHCWMGGALLWGAVARELADAGCRVVMWDQRGHGSSTLGSSPLTVDQLGDDLHAVLNDLGIRDAVLVGHSMGGMTIQAYAAHHKPDFDSRVRGVVLAATAARPGLVKVPLLVSRLLVGEWQTPAMSRKADSNDHRPAGPFAHQESVKASYKAMAATTGAARSGFLTAMSRMDWRPDLAAICVPTRILVGTNDRLTPVARARELAAGVPGSELTLLRGRRHMLPYEAPAAIVSAAIGLTSKDGPAQRTSRSDC